MVKAVQAIFRMAKNDSLFKSQTSRGFQKSKTFLKTLLESDIDLTRIGFNLLRKTCPVHLLLRVALIVGAYLKKRIRWTSTFFTPLDKQFTSINVFRLSEQLSIEKKDKALLEMYMNQVTTK